MCIWRAQDRGMQRAARHRQIVAEPAAAEQQIGVFDAPHRPLGESAAHPVASLCVGHCRATRRNSASRPWQERTDAAPCLAERRPTPMPNLRRSVLFTALAALLAGSVVSAAVAVTPTSPNKDQSAGKSAPQTVPEDPATSGSSTEPLSDKLDRQGG